MSFVTSFQRNFLRFDYATQLTIAVSLSVVLHGIFLFGVNFKIPDPKKFDSANSPMEVVLVNSKSATKPTHADALAQANLDGGGNTDLDRRAKSPLPVLSKQQPQPEEAQKAQQVQALEQQAQKLMMQVKSTFSQDQTEEPQQKPTEKSVAPNATQMAAKALEMARLEAQVSKDWDSYQKRPKRMFVGARTKEYSFARYVEDWRIKVERVGNLNYPEEAKQQKLYGSLQLTVSIKADGSLENVEINRSSGHITLDQAAVRIVRLAAPYAPFTEEIRQKVDILSITRTWIFARGDQLSSMGAE
ncbi:TonB family protein [Sulfurirhabdus autotrophica]|uniref:Protein TonB n=1 Tax=Sulfurirhabdus autotrophica TaxID=1706046 RepID=A0A4R3Y4M4_9PROT|nr:TonB family protein [Sulfurirhabdus autotrophica]TCV86351.1 protein TonB [Sulfurirhabdus autotrophica]